MPRKRVALVLNASQESDHKRTEKHPWVGQHLGRSSVILTRANLVESWEPKANVMGGAVNGKLRKKTHSVLRKLFEMFDYAEKKQNKVAGGRQFIIT